MIKVEVKTRTVRVQEEVLQPGFAYPEGEHPAFILETRTKLDENKEPIMGTKVEPVTFEICDKCGDKFASGARRRLLKQPFTMFAGSAGHEKEFELVPAGVFHEKCYRTAHNEGLSKVEVAPLDR